MHLSRLLSSKPEGFEDNNIVIEDSEFYSNHCVYADDKIQNGEYWVDTKYNKYSNAAGDIKVY